MGRSDHVAVYDSKKNRMIIYGGWDKWEKKYFDDTWAFDLNYDVWINITPGPQPRIDQQAVYDPQGQRLIIYGGDARLNSKFHDVWELQIQPNLPIDLLLKEAGSKTGAAMKP
jgi:hypothetical protein